MKHFPIIAALVASIILIMILDIPTWVSGVFAVIIYTLFFYPPVALRSNLVLFNPIVYTAIVLGIHLYTVVIAFHDSIWKALASLLLPVIAEVYWFVVIAKEEGTIQTPYCITIIFFVFLWIYQRLLLPFLLASLRSNSRE
ncbi:MAG TPA: hypothetical protein DD713_03075 [Nitrospiraceae bacterium]|nr:hypothetical protein [Nitrospiraceae bacterium]